MKDVDLPRISFRYSPAFRAIREDGLDIAVLKSDLRFASTSRCYGVD